MANQAIQGIQLALQKQAPQASADGMSQADSVPADYQGPENGPFECDDCQFFKDPGSCQQPKVVQELGDQGDGTAQVDPHGCCNKFKKGQAQ